MDKIYKEVAQATGLKEKHIKMIAQCIFESISYNLSRGESVKVYRFGVFETRCREARLGVNPKTREELKIPDKYYPAFKPSETLKNVVETGRYAQKNIAQKKKQQK